MAVTIEIKNGALDLLSQGVVIMNGNEITSFKLKVDNEELNLLIRFNNSEKDTTQVKKEAKVINSTTLEITFTNYNNTIGNYTKDFWRIGQIKGRGLYWSYAIYGFTDGNIKKMEYTFYLGEGVVNG